MAIVRGVCDKCKNKTACSRPCWFLEMLLSDVTDGSLEKPTSEKELIHFGNSYWETRFSEMHPATLKKLVFDLVQVDPEPEADPDRRFDDLEFAPEQKTADVFYMRFFQGKSYQEIGEKHGINHRDAASLYSEGRKRVIEILKMLDGRDKALKFCNDRTRIRFTKYEKAFLLNKIFGFSFREVAEILGCGPDWIRHRVNDMANGYKEAFKGE